MRYMMFIKHSGDYEGAEVPPSLYEAMGAFVQEQIESGAFIDGAGLQPLARGTRVRLAGGEISVTDGPFAEAKEVVGGYSLIEAGSHNEAVALATRFMELHREHWPEFEGEAEVRALEDPGADAESISGDQRQSGEQHPASGESSAEGAPGHVPTQGLYGWITHTELASADPAATRDWCAKVLGWEFMPSMPSPDGEYHLFSYAEQGGGGIRATNPPEVPGSIPYVHVADAQAIFEDALSEGAEAMLPPMKVMEGVTIAIVRAPGGVPIGFSGP